MVNTPPRSLSYLPPQKVRAIAPRQPSIHQAGTTNTRLSANKEAGFKCPYLSCHKFLSSNYYLVKHLEKIHTQEKNHPCEECDLSFDKRTYLLDHWRSVHAEQKPYKCLKCKEGFGELQALKKHQKSVRCGQIGKKNNLDRLVSYISRQTETRASSSTTHLPVTEQQTTFVRIPSAISTERPHKKTKIAQSKDAQIAAEALLSLANTRNSKSPLLHVSTHTRPQHSPLTSAAQASSNTIIPVQTHMQSHTITPLPTIQRHARDSKMDIEYVLNK